MRRRHPGADGDAVKPTAAEVHAELRALRSLRGQIPHYAEFGIDNFDMLAAQTQVIEYNLSMAQIARQFGEEAELCGAAEDALYWQQGGDVLSPAESWANVAKTVLESA